MGSRTILPAAGGLVVVAVLALGAVLLVGFDWREPPWRAALERELGRAAGRPVSLAGPVSLRVSARPTLLLEDVRIGPPPGAGGGNGGTGNGGTDTVRIGRLELRAGLLPSLLARWPHIDRIEAGGIEWRADAGTDGTGAAVTVDRIEGQAPAGGPLALRASGAVAGKPFQAELEGGSLASLADAESDWPIALFVEAVGASLRVAGALRGATSEGGRSLAGSFEFGVGALDAQATARLLDADLPALGPSALAGRVYIEPGRAQIRELIGSVGASHFEGELAIVPGDTRPWIEGRILADVLDMRPFLGQGAGPEDVVPDAAGPGESPGTLVDWYRGLDDARLPVGSLRLVDGRVALAVERWIGMPADVGAASVEMELVDGRLDAPLHAHVAGVDLSGGLHAEVDAGGAIRADLGVGTAETPLGGLARWLLGLQDLQGALGGFSMRLVAGGATMREIVDSTELRMVVSRGGLSYGHAPGARPVAFELGSLTMVGGGGEALRIDADGSLLDEPVEFSLVTDPPHRIVRRGTSTLDLRASSRSLRLAVDGRVAVGAVGAARDAADLSLRFEAGDVRDLARWLGTGIAEPMPLAVAARLRGTRERWRIDPLEASLGRHRLGATVLRQDGGDGPRLAIGLDLPRVDIDELARLFDRASHDAGPLALDIPVLPARIELADLDLDLRIGEISRSALSIRDLRFATRIHDGFMSASPLSLVALGVPLAGALEVDLRSDVPAVNWWLAGVDIDAGRLLGRLGFGNRIDAAFDSLALHLAARGSRLGDLLDASAMTAEIEGGHLRLLDPGTGGAAGFDLATGSVVAGSGQPLRAAVAGRAGPDPVAIALQTASLRQLLDTGRKIPVALQAVLGGARISLSGDIERPLGAGLRMTIDVAGDRVDGWSPLVDIDLPDWGPYALAGDIVVDAGGYRVEGARVSVGGSSANGGGRLDTSRSPPRLELQLDAPVLDLDDFDDADWSPFSRGAVAAPATDEREPQAAPASGTVLSDVGGQAARASDELQQLLGADTLARLDAQVGIDVRALRSGEIRLGDARLHLSVQDGRVRFDPVAASIGEGQFRLALDYAPLASGPVETAIELVLDRVDYGLLARRIDPGTDMAGEIDARLEVHARAPILSQAMRHGNGSLRFRLRPQRMRADVFDLWAGNLFIALANRLDADRQSRVNCALGEFDLADGVLRAQRMLIDSTRVRVLGTGTVDFNDASLALRFNPWPKRAQFFSLATPIEVAGSFDDFSIGPGAGDVVMTGLRLVSSVLWVPVMKLAGVRSPLDGADVCGESPLATTAAGTPDDSLANAPTDLPAPRQNFSIAPAFDDATLYGGP